MRSAPHVCIVDDGDDYRFLLQELFSQYFPAYSVSLFAGGKVFIKELTQLRPIPNLILLDRHMPDFDGHQTLLIVKGNPVYKKIPIVMMSADASTDEISGCYESGVNSFLRKSMNFDSMKNQMAIVCQYWLDMNLNPVEMV